MSQLLYLRSFLSVYRHNSISKAADALHLTQPAVSRHIKVLENHLQCKLFERLPRGLASTPAATELERQVGPHLDALQRVVDSAGSKNASLEGIIHAGSTSGFAKLIFSGLATLPQYGIRLDLRSAPPPVLMKALVDGELDLAVTPARIPHKAVEYDLLYEGSLILVCAPRWRERLLRTGAPGGVPLIEVQGPLPALTNYWRVAFGRNPDLPSVTVPDYQAALDAAAAGTGLSVVPECLCSDMLQTGQLIGRNARTKARISLYIARGKGSAGVDRVDVSRQLLLDAARNW
ncbi:LysR family transcriptional regulator [Paraburkholderia madseniana]|uniref:LysR family transcriptional regulator n=1 Tax=Paraburkholderia madseniana TaxID=2599607 RepID=A0A6N6WLC7_9BURK|nr:LysR family transcriptional regulator [Paraburkholderia madseniana]KAE8760731.1 LysR family transcriptional regulator [Paraburkholderia madseniana]NPT62738.1 LysR family transcriptional regulator [Paraburkholderia madseniana]